MTTNAAVIRITGGKFTQIDYFNRIPIDKNLDFVVDRVEALLMLGCGVEPGDAIEIDYKNTTTKYEVIGDIEGSLRLVPVAGPKEFGS